MSYSNNHPIRLIGGRLALDFANTADWNASGAVTHEKIVSHRDLRIWADAAGLPEAALPVDMADAHALRRVVRSMFVPETEKPKIPERLLLEVPPDFSEVRKAPLLNLIALSAVAILADERELGRVKMCPGDDCGWLFIDETRNARRRWCLMETCGNRAKAARHYARTKKSPRD